MKKLLSLALASALCLSLTVQAMAAGKPGETTFTDKNGTYTLSSPILYTLSRSDLEGIDRTNMKISVLGEPYDETFSGPADAYFNDSFWSGISTVYAVPAGTVVTLPDNVLTSMIFQLDVTFEDGAASAPTFGVFNYPGFTSVSFDNGGYILGVALEYLEMDISSDGSAVDGNNAGTLYFYVPEKGGSTENPFASAPTTPSKPAFSDVAANAYYADAVNWAVERNITSGTTATTFSPNATCTKAQILTFLWRANGSPVPTISNPFSDIPTGAYYADAAVWAYEKGLISGGTFSGDTPATRADTVTYLWKLAGSPDASPANFSDVPANAEYAEAVAWAVKEGITSGTGSTTFSPDVTCTRGQIVTFLYRAFAE